MAAMREAIVSLALSPVLQKQQLLNTGAGLLTEKFGKDNIG